MGHYLRVFRVLSEPGLADVPDQNDPAGNLTAAYVAAVAAMRNALNVDTLSKATLRLIGEARSAEVGPRSPVGAHVGPRGALAARLATSATAIGPRAS